MAGRALQASKATSRTQARARPPHGAEALTVLIAHQRSSSSSSAIGEAEIGLADRTSFPAMRRRVVELRRSVAVGRARRYITPASTELEARLHDPYLDGTGPSKIGTRDRINPSKAGERWMIVGQRARPAPPLFRLHSGLWHARSWCRSARPISASPMRAAGARPLGAQSHRQPLRPRARRSSAGPGPRGRLRRPAALTRHKIRPRHALPPHQPHPLGQALSGGGQAVVLEKLLPAEG